MVLLEDKELEKYAEEEDEEEEDKEKESFDGGTTNSTTTVPPNSFFYQTITSSSSSKPSIRVGGGAGELSSTETETVVVVEKEHMFHKVVTPSDVGKLNRLVIPKQHAEKYFPLDSAGSEKGLLLNFEDGAGKQWQFRYSYWNSSQSYVMTKGWSRFVKDKKLDAGDIVSFERGAFEPHRHRFFINWKRRPGLPPSHLPHHHHHHHHHHRSVPWGRLFFPPMPTYTSYTASAAGSTASFYNLHPLLPPPPLVYESVPLMQGKTGAVVAADGKRVRLFGVNLDCPEPHELQQQHHQQQ